MEKVIFAILFLALIVYVKLNDILKQLRSMEKQDKEIAMTIIEKLSAISK